MLLECGSDGEGFAEQRTRGYNLCMTFWILGQRLVEHTHGFLNQLAVQMPVVRNEQDVAKVLEIGSPVDGVRILPTGEVPVSRHSNVQGFGLSRPFESEAECVCKVVEG